MAESTSRSMRASNPFFISNDEVVEFLVLEEVSIDFINEPLELLFRYTQSIHD